MAWPRRTAARDGRLESSDEADRVSVIVLAALDLPSAAKAKVMNEACERHEEKMMADGASGRRRRIISGKASGNSPCFSNLGGNALPRALTSSALLAHIGAAAAKNTLAAARSVHSQEWYG